MTSIYLRFQFLAGVLFFGLLLSEPSYAFLPAPALQNNHQFPDVSAGKSRPRFLVENKEEGKEELHHKSGSLVMPLDSNKEDKEGKKCMTVCTRWGQDCIIDPARGRKCRRTCKEFGEECF